MNSSCQYLSALYLCNMGEYSLGDALKGFINKSRLKNGVRAVQIGEVWEQLMGKTIAKYTEKIEIINHTLFIHTNVGPLKQELQYQKPQIIERINEAFEEKVINQVIIQ
jgi:hypothetical protein